ncbi:MAG: uroporphyrinogen-III C-methyltransferase, partial [Candidatus Omnitrophica bacterium]|nr:uroporphyrinogen-III C-methyltransferase [Candidatus Omnitrophota bacterium]
MHLRIGSRASTLAAVQVEEIIRLLGGNFPHKLFTFKTRGDEDKTTPLASQPADDFFTGTIDQALLKGDIDIAVHSAKDLPKDLRPGLEIFALTASLDDTDAWVSRWTWNDLPSGSKVGTSSLLRQQQVRILRPDLHLVDIRGTVEERLKLIDQGVVDGIIIATCALKRLNLEDAIRDVLPWEGTPLQGQLAVVGRESDIELKKVIQSIDVRLKHGKVTLVGAGPGDPDLITLKGIKILGKADCVLYDYLADKSLLKHAPGAEHIYAGKRKGEHTLSQDDLSRMLRAKAMQGLHVVRLKGGDPLIFGRGAEEIQYLNSYHIQVDVVPGITSATGIPSYLGVPLTARGIASSVAFVSGHGEDENLSGPQPIRIPRADTIVFLMGLTKLKEIVQSLKAAGWSLQTPILIISKGTRMDEQVAQGDLAAIEDLVHKSALQPPVLIIAGETTRFYKKGPQKIFLHCGTHPELYRDLGRIIAWPMIEIKPVALDDQQRIKLVEEFTMADLILLTSPAASGHFMNIILQLKPLQEVRHKVLAVIGRHTGQALEGFGISPQIISPGETAQGFFQTLMAIMHVRGKKILFPRSSLPNPFLKDSLESQGARVMEWTIYSNTKPPRRDLPERNIDGIIFTSPSTVKNFLEDYKTIPAGWEILAKGPVTQAALKE